MFLEILKDYFSKSQFHGLRYLVQNERHWIERIFWIFCIVASWYGCILLILSSLNAFKNNALSFGTDTSYIEWNTTLYSISVCEDDYEDKIQRVGPELYEGIEDDYNLFTIIKEFVFFKGILVFSKTGCTDGSYDCPQSGYKKIAQKLRSFCNETFKYCEWNGEIFNCCEHFQVLETEIGLCFSLNSMQVKNPKYYPLINNKQTGPGIFYMEFFIPVIVYIHAAEDVPNFNSELKDFTKVTPGWVYTKQYSITEIENDKDLKDIDINLRRCRYPDESDLTIYPYYSTSACVVDCRIKEHMRLCNCTSHFAPNTRDEDICDFDGLLCLSEHFEDYSSIINPWTQKKGIVCQCLPSCFEPEIDLLRDSAEERDVDEYEYEEDEDNVEISSIKLILDRLPTLRLKRIVVRSRLDLVVSLGGTVGLFVGASLLSFVEFAYFFTIRTYNIYKENRGKNKMRKGNFVPLHQRSSKISHQVPYQAHPDLMTSPNGPYLVQENIGFDHRNENFKIGNGVQKPDLMTSDNRLFPAQFLNSGIYTGYGNNYYNRYANNYLNSFYM